VRVSVVIVNWNGGDALLECLDALSAQSRPADEIVVVDNASTDGSPERASTKFHNLAVLQNEHNLGFGPAVNQGVGASCGDWIALLNNDAVVDRDWLEALTRAARTAPNIGMVASKIFLDRSARILDKVGHRIALDGQNFGRGHGLADDGRYSDGMELAWPDGCAGLWKRSVFEQVGGFDEDFFAYADDADLGIRFRLAGWRCVLAADAIVEHRHSATLGAYSARKLYLVERNRIWLAAKYFSWPLLALNPLLWLGRVVLTGAALAAGGGPFASVRTGERRAVLAAILRAQWDGWRGVPLQRRKRARLADRCGDDWERRLTRLLRAERAPLHHLAYGRLR